MRFVSALCVVAVVVLSGCSTYAASRYSVSVDNVVAIKAHEGKRVNVGPFSGVTESDIMCRGGDPVKTPDGETFADYIRKALVDEVRLAGIFSTSAPVTLAGNLNSVDFSSNVGLWDLSFTMTSSNGKTMTVTEQYEYATSFNGDTACNQTAQAFMPAVQNLVGKVVRSPNFAALLDPTGATPVIVIQQPEDGATTRRVRARLSLDP